MSPKRRAVTPEPAEEMARLSRSPSLQVQVEGILREAITGGKFRDNRLPTEIELAEQLGVSRETVRRATEVLKREGLLVKFRRKGTFLAPPPLTLKQHEALPCVGYFQASYHAGPEREEAVCRTIDGLLLQGAADEAARQGLTFLVQRLPRTGRGDVFQRLASSIKLTGAIFASFGEEKLLGRVLSLGLPLVLVDHDLTLPGVSTVRDDSYEGARQAVAHLAGLGHRRIALVYWRQAELNPWRLRGYRQGLRDVALPRRHKWEIHCELTEAGARQAVEQFLTITPRPTALYCFNNTLARFIMEELARRQLRIPEEVSVMGAGGEEVPGLTCTVIDWHAMGRAAVQILQHVAANKVRAPEHRLFPHQLITGRTVAQVEG